MFFGAPYSCGSRRRPAPHGSSLAVRWLHALVTTVSSGSASTPGWARSVPSRLSTRRRRRLPSSASAEIVPGAGPRHRDSASRTHLRHVAQADEQPSVLHIARRVPVAGQRRGQFARRALGCARVVAEAYEGVARVAALAQQRRLPLTVGRAHESGLAQVQPIVGLDRARLFTVAKASREIV